MFIAQVTVFQLCVRYELYLKGVVSLHTCFPKGNWTLKYFGLVSNTSFIFLSSNGDNVLKTHVYCWSLDNPKSS